MSISRPMNVAEIEQQLQKGREHCARDPIQSSEIVYRVFENIAPEDIKERDLKYAGNS